MVDWNDPKAVAEWERNLCKRNKDYSPQATTAALQNRTASNPEAEKIVSDALSPEIREKEPERCEAAEAAEQGPREEIMAVVDAAKSLAAEANKNAADASSVARKASKTARRAFVVSAFAALAAVIAIFY